MLEGVTSVVSTTLYEGVVWVGPHPPLGEVHQANCERKDLNLRPLGYEPSELPLLHAA